MRVLVWSEAFAPTIGGVERFLEGWCRHLRAQGQDVLVLAAHGEMPLPDVSQWEGIPVHRVRLFEALGSRDPVQVLQLRRQIASAVSAFRPDLTHVNLLGPGALLVAERPETGAIVVSIHTSVDSLQSAGADTALGRVLRRARWVTACSDAALGSVLRIAPDIAARSLVIPYGVDVPDSQPPAPPAGSVEVLFVGRLIDMKGADLAIEALARVRESVPGARLTIVGDGPERPALEAQAESLDVRERVRFRGWQTEEEVAAAMDGASVVVMPSRATGSPYTEGLGLVAVEAAARARPVVASRVGGVPEVVVDGQTGRLVDPGDVKALADAIESLLADPAVGSRMGKAAWARARRLFSSRAALAALDAVCSESLEIA